MRNQMAFIQQLEAMVVCGSLRWQGVMWVEQEMELREEVEDGGRKVLSGFYFLRDDGYMAI